MDLEFLKNKNKFKKGGIHIDREIYWNGCLAVGLLIIFAGAAYGFILFRGVSREQEPAPLDIGKVIDKNALAKTLNYFNEREKNSENVINSPSPLADPS
jgi:hypothetical protein